METTAPALRGTVAPIGALLALPLIGLGALLAWPTLDGMWAHNPSHLWIVLAAAVLNAVLAYATGVAAERRADLRVALVSLGFLASACFLGLHALATPRVLIDAPNAGFVVATPVGLTITAAFAAGSSLVPASGPPPALVRAVPILRWGLVAVVVAWAAWSLAGLPPLSEGGDRPDHAADALRAAVAMQRETGRIADENPGWPRFRVGVNTGPAIVCVLGAAGGRTYTVIGDTVNVASRLEGLAPVGGVALGPETARRVGAARTEPLGSVALKGRDATVEALLLVDLDPEATAAR